MKRIAVVGSSGAGKSTFALELGRRLAIPVIHLDRHYWQPGWVKTPRAVWREQERALLQTETWIADGNYWNTLDLRLDRADTLIFLDMPRLLCLWRVVGRVLSYRPGMRPDMAAGCHERFDAEFLRYVWSYPVKMRPRILEAFERYAGQKTFVRLRNPRQVKAFLEGLEARTP